MTKESEKGQRGPPKKSEAELEWEEMQGGGSFLPRQWFDEDGPISSLDEEGKRMWVYLRIGERWIVGFYSPDREWHEESQFPDKEKAAARVHWLNGGVKNDREQKNERGG